MDMALNLLDTPLDLNLKLPILYFKIHDLRLEIRNFITVLNLFYVKVLDRFKLIDIFIHGLQLFFQVLIRRIKQQ